MSIPVRAVYSMWPQYNRRLREVIAAMSDDQLAIRPSVNGWPIWATVGHLAGLRVFWLCHVVGEPGAETTPFLDSSGDGWEDHLDHPRDAGELAGALDSTWRILDGCLDRWTLDMLGDEIRRDRDPEVHTRGTLLQRMFSHDAYHCGELSQTLGIHGLAQIDLWRFEDGAATRR